VFLTAIMFGGGRHVRAGSHRTPFYGNLLGDDFWLQMNFVFCLGVPLSIWSCGKVRVHFSRQLISEGLSASWLVFKYRYLFFALFFVLANLAKWFLLRYDSILDQRDIGVVIVPLPRDARALAGLFSYSWQAAVVRWRSGAVYPLEVPRLYFLVLKDQGLRLIGAKCLAHRTCFICGLV